MVVAVKLADLSRQRATHRHPIEEFNALSTSLLDQIMDREAGEPLRVVGDIIEAKLIELFIEKSGPFAVELVGEAAGPDDQYAQVLRVALQRPADRLPELEAARQRRERVLHGVDRDGDDPDRRALARPHQLQWYGHRVVDQHVLTHGDVELVGNKRIDQVPRQRRVAGGGARNRDAPTFVLVPVFRRRPNREGRQFVEEEVEAMVVVEDYGDVRFLAREPAVNIVEAVEKRLPIGIVLFAVGNGLADRRYVRCCDAANDVGDDYLPAATNLALNSSTVVPVCWAPIS